MDIVGKTGATAVIVLNACPVGRSVAEASIVTEARQALAAYGLLLAPIAVAQRAAFSYALNDGRAVSEFEPDGKAAAELRRYGSGSVSKRTPLRLRQFVRGKESSHLHSRHWCLLPGRRGMVLNLQPQLRSRPVGTWGGAARLARRRSRDEGRRVTVNDLVVEALRQLLT